MQEGPKTRRLPTQSKTTPQAKATKTKEAAASPQKKATAVYVETNGHASPGQLANLFMRTAIERASCLYGHKQIISSIGMVTSKYLAALGDQ